MNKLLNQKTINDIKVGDVVTCWIDLGHDYIEYDLKVTSIDERDFDKDDNGNKLLVAYGEGLTEEDVDFIECEVGTCRIDASNFVRVK